MRDPEFFIAFASVAAVGGGLLLLLRGLLAHRAGERIRGTATSQVESLAAGEVRIVGVVEPGPITLVSPLQSEPCVFYRARITEEEGNRRVTAFEDERAAGFRVRDATGALRVFPRGASWDLPAQFEESTDLLGGDPPGLRRNRGPATTATIEDREAAIARLLTVQLPGDPVADDGGRGRRHFREERLAAGDMITVVGAALPFREIDDPASADRWDPRVGLADPEIARSIAEARAAGTLRATPAEAWGNAAIPGFGIGRPTRAPDLDPEAAPPALASPAQAARTAAAFEIAPDELVLAATPEIGLAIRAGTPDQAADRDRGALLLGLGGAVLAIAGAVAFALVIERWIG